MNNKILIVGAHPDDEILGVGGTVFKHIKEGDEIYVCILTQATFPLWSDDYIKDQLSVQKEIDNLIQTKKRFNLNLPTTQLNIIPRGKLNQLVIDVVNEINPTTVYTHFSHDIHIDHQITFNACLVATRPPKHINLISYECLSETEWGEKPFFPNCWTDITSFIDQKIEVFKMYKSEIKKFPHCRNTQGIIHLARKRGFECGFRFAEAFKILRWYN